MVELATLQAVSYIMGSLGVFVAAVYYVLNIQNNRRNQKLILKAQEQSTETRKAQLFMQLYSHWSDESFHESATDIRNMVWNDYDDFRVKILEKPNMYRSLGTQIRFYEGLGVLVKKGLIDMGYIGLLMSGDIRHFWEKLRPIVGAWRTEWVYPRLASETEYLYSELMKYMLEHPELAT